MSHKTENVAPITDYKKEWMVAKQVADYLAFDSRYFSEKFLFRTPDFPAAVRLTANGHRRWLKSEIDRWISTKREDLAA